ncbi:MAG: UDP-3-O-(3-hydroxymyristoyl)glucosamine N-acyltransferase [Candidatus Omnitrophica bacterium]|nr:UDP-3-O-(3-hydroxymyristoyl)glucosamine N-acyltransferase [Candidatus Omnitrophota bacterium]
MFKKTVGDIAKLIDGEVVGDRSVVITDVCGIKEAKEGDITFIANPRYLPLIEMTKASCIITPYEVCSAPKPIIRTENPSLAFARVISLLSPDIVRYPKGIHKTAVIGENVKLGRGVAIGPYCVIEDNVSIGDKTVLYAGVYVGHNTKIGQDCLIYPHVSIRENITIGSRVIIHSGTVIGSDGFGFVAVEGIHHKIPQVGVVVIEDDVEIGANVTIDRARFGKTQIGKSTKIDNLVQIAHNVIIGENSIIVAQAGISGSTTIGKNVTLAGQSGVAGHINIGDYAVVAGQAGVTKSIPPNTCVSGYPAKPHNQAKRINALIQRLPLIVKRIERLEKELKGLEERLSGASAYNTKRD